MAIAWWAYVAVVAALSAYALHRLHLVLAVWRACRPAAREGKGAPPAAPRAAPPDELPVVTVQLPIYNERFVVERLIDAVAALDWPQGRLEVQVLDDSTDDTAALCRERVAEWRRRGLAIEQVRRGDRAGFKAGALQHGLARARGELLLVLDADFVPPPDLLRRMVGHLADPGAAMVQARWEHLNRDASALTGLQALLLDGHFGVEQTARARRGCFFNFNGTAGLWRRSAIDDAGGWQGDTLTEDLDLSYRVLLRGWRFAYLLEEAVPGELPADMNGFKSQQFRWAKGSMQVARKLLPAVLRSRRGAAVKLEALFHLTHNLPYLLTAALALLAVPALAWRDDQGIGSVWLEVVLACGAAAVTAAYLVTAQAAVRGSRLGLRAVASVVARVPAIIALTAGISISQSRAVLEGLAGRPSEFVRTPKQGAVGARGDRKPAPAAGYASSAGALPILELAAAAYLAAGLAQALAAHRFTAAPILALFALGFAWIGGGSLTAAMKTRASGKKSGR
ncbi:MAG TPA: glycosyltransferase [Kofleriaceae bacterium]|nr:glycosyltransferase [Kofleriaceae bacterium]